MLADVMRSLVEACRKLAKTKAWRVKRLIEKAKIV